MTKKTANTPATVGDAGTKPRKAPRKAPRAKPPAKAGPSATIGAEAALGPRHRDGTKQAALIAMLRRAEGATVAEIMTATGWQAHTVRGAIAGALKKKLGLAVSSEKIETRGRVYRIAD
jgi:hypothetical protein